MNIKKLKRQINQLVEDFERENETTILQINIYTETIESRLGKTKVTKREINFLCE